MNRRTTRKESSSGVGDDNNSPSIPATLVTADDPKQKRRRQRKIIKPGLSSKSGGLKIAGMMLIAVGLLVLGFFVGKQVSVYLFLTQQQQGGDTSSTSSSNIKVALISSNNPNGLPLYPKITRDKEPVELSPAALEMCTQTLWHTLETTTIVLPNTETFIHTGDIDDLWLRDSAAQIHTLLLPMLSGGKALIATDPRLDRVVAGLIQRTAMYIRHDPYANAFRIDDSYKFSKAQKELGRHDLISTWNYELDSACYFIRMLYFYWKASPKSTARNSVLRVPTVQNAISIMLEVWTAEQQHEHDQYPTGPLLDCLNCNKPYRYKGLARDGKGSPTNATSGLTWTGFRPSDDECKFHFLIPANMFAVTVLEYIVEIVPALEWKAEIATKAQALANQIQKGIDEHAIYDHPSFGKIYAYEVDGFGEVNLMDDANIPNLVSIPYLGYRHYDEIIYQNTRKFIFSKRNPTFKSGTNELTGPIEGYGSPHMELRIRDNIWPMSLAMKGLTSDSIEEKRQIVEQLVQASGGTHWMHESFDVNDPRKFTRSWFCWADSLFAELAMSISPNCPASNSRYRVLEWREFPIVEGGHFAEDA